MNCERCGKRLSKKGARIINGLVVCGVCMWKPTPANAIAAGSQRAKTPQAVECEASQSGPKGIAQPSPPSKGQ